MSRYINYEKPYNKINKNIATTPIIRNNNKYTLPLELTPSIEVEIYNKKTNKYRKADSYIAIVVNKVLKTDEILKIIY